MDINRKAGQFFTLSSGETSNYEYISGEEKLLSD